MKAKTTLLLTLGVLGCCGVQAAQADPLPPPPAPPIERGVAPYDVIAIVRSMHLDPVTAPIRRGTRYVVRAIDRWGNTVRVVVDAEVARVIALRPVRRVREAFAPPDDDRRMPAYGAPPNWRDSHQGWDEEDEGDSASVEAPNGMRWGPPPGRLPSQADAAPSRPELAPQARLTPETQTAPRVIYADPQPRRTPPPSRLTPRISKVTPNTPLPRPRPAAGNEQAALPRAAEPQHNPEAKPTPKLEAKTPAPAPAEKQKDEKPAATAALGHTAASPAKPVTEAPAASTAHDAPVEKKKPDLDFPPVQPPF